MSFSGKVEIAANTATILVAALLSAVLIRFFLVPQKSSQQVSLRPQALLDVVKIGDDIKAGLPTVNWRDNGRTLVLAISTECHFCRDSTPLYRQLAGKQDRKFKIVAVMPQPVDAAKKYLEGQGVHVDQVEQRALSGIGVRGTPTLILTDSSGIVQNVWVGKLESTRENQLLAALGVVHTELGERAAAGVNPNKQPDSARTQ